MKQIAILIPAILNPLQNELIDSVYKTVSKYGYDVLVITNTTNAHDHYPHNDYTTGEENIFSLIETVRPDGIVFVSQDFKKTALKQTIAEHIRKAGIPCVDTGGEGFGFETVKIPQENVFYDMTAHLIEKHHCRNLLCLAGFEGNADSDARIAGFVSAAKNYTANHDVVYGDFWKDKAMQLGKEILSGKRKKPDAVVCASDIMAIALCDVLQDGGLSVPDDIIITGYDAHIAALSHFPSMTTIGGQSRTLGILAAEKLLKILGEEVTPSPDAGLYMVYGASCGCVDQMNDYRSSFLQVEQFVYRELEKDDVHEMQTTTNYIAAMSDIQSLDDLISAADQTAHILTGFQTLDISLCEDWAGDLQAPGEYRNEGYSSQAELILSKRISLPSQSHIRFFTEHLIPALMTPHDPMLLYVLPVHYILRNYGYCVISFAPGIRFRIAPLLVSWLDAFANGLRTLQKKMYTDYLHDLVEQSSLRDTMTGLLSQKGLLQYLQACQKNKRRCGILLLTISRLLAVPGKKNTSLSNSILQSELLLAGALRLLDSKELTAARINEKTFAVVFSLTKKGTVDAQTGQIVTKIEVMMKKMQETAAYSYLPELFHQSSIVETGTEEELSDKLHILEKSAKTADVPKTIDLSMLKKLHKELHSAPGLDWNQTVMAERMNISVSYLQKLYKKQFGISFMDDLVWARLEKSITLLTTTDLRIQEIAEQCGYRHATHFMRQFKAKMGVTPSEYRIRRNQ